MCERRSSRRTVVQTTHGTSGGDEEVGAYVRQERGRRRPLRGHFMMRAGIAITPLSPPDIVVVKISSRPVAL